MYILFNTHQQYHLATHMYIEYNYRLAACDGCKHRGLCTLVLHYIYIYIHVAVHISRATG